MNTKEKALEIIKSDKKITPKDLSEKAGVSRQQASKVINKMKDEGVLVAVGRGPQTIYISPESDEIFDFKFQKTFENKNIEEDKIVSEAKLSAGFLKKLPDNTKSIFDYAFSEMINNAIDHSDSEKIKVEVGKEKNFLVFTVRDFGVGVFRNIIKKKNLASETDAIQDLLKGKMTTMPEAHSGEGIFFTSRVADVFVLESFDYVLQVNKMIDDVFVSKNEKQLQGTKVIFRIEKNTAKDIENVFRNYQSVEKEFGFDKTEVVVKLYENDVDYVSRSQARRVLVGLEKFKKIIFDFKRVSGIGQAFADEIFRIFQKKHPDKELLTRNENEAVKFMIERAKK
jgi:DNA-binding MarR family transcriptional regulator